MKALYTLVYNRKNKLNKDGEALVQIRVYYKRENKYLSTGIYLLPKQWDPKRNEVSQHHPEADELNRELQAHIEKLKTHERNEAKAGRPLVLSTLSLDNLQLATPTLSFTEFWHTWVETDNQLEYETKRTHRSDLNRLKEFKEEVHFFELTPELLRSYEAFLLKYRFIEYTGQEKPLSYSRIHGLFKTVRAYVNRAIQEGYIEPQNDPFLRFSTAKYRKVANQTTRKYLTPEEIHLLENLQIPEHLDYLEKIRDMFLLSCYAGLRYSDVVKLDESCLQYSKGEGYSLYYSMQQKTKVDVLVPIYLLFDRKPEQIVKKYLKKGDKKLFKGLTNQYVNRSLKQLAFLAGIERRVTFHMGRHSCATLLLDMGLSYEVVQQILGHTNIRTTQIYGKVRKEAVKKALKAVKWDKGKRGKKGPGSH